MTYNRRDILLAGAIGDAVGYIIEFMRLDRIQKLYGEEGLTLAKIPESAKLYISDDTQMTLFALEAVKEIRGFSSAPPGTLYQLAFNRWYVTQTDADQVEGLNGLMGFLSMQHRRGPGNTCLGALAQQKPIFSKGCGGVMRAVPSGFGVDPDSAFTWGAVQAALTHSDPDAFLPAGFLAALISKLEDTKDEKTLPFVKLYEALDVALNILKEKEKHEATLDLIESAINMADETDDLTDLHDKQEDIAILGEGWVGHEALAIAIYAVLASNNFEECIQASINHSGDSDSTGAIAAQIWAATYGLPAKYKAWASRLCIADAFEYMTEGLDSI